SAGAARLRRGSASAAQFDRGAGGWSRHYRIEAALCTGHAPMRAMARLCAFHNGVQDHRLSFKRCRGVASRNIHLVGSVPLANACDVFTTVSAALGPRLLRIPDGETGERSDWIPHLEPVFATHPQFEKSDEVFRLPPTAPPRTRYR